MASFLEHLGERVLVCDGAMGTFIHAAGLSPQDYVLPPNSGGNPELEEAINRFAGKPVDGCHEVLNLSRPDVIRDIHCMYLDAGSDIIQTNAFGISSIVLGEFDIPNLDYVLSLACARVAREAADSRSTPEKPRFVIGSIGPGTKLVTLGQTSFDALEATHYRAFKGMLEGKVDVLMLETLQDLLMVKAGIVGADRAMAETGIRVPIMVQVTMEPTGTMLVGSELAAALNFIESFPNIVAFGMNCATGPVEMEPHMQFLSQHSSRPISVQPNAGLPTTENGKAVYKLTPVELANHHVRFVEQYGAAIVGGCCGTTPEHLRAVSQAVHGLKPSQNAHWQKVRKFFPDFNFTYKTAEQDAAISLKGCSSLFQFQPYQQDASILIVGERTNANGSKAFRDALAEDNWEMLTDIAREQEAEGSHILDVCTAYVGRNEVNDMCTLLESLNKNISIPIMVDSTEVPVIEEALKRLAGKPLINSINFEDGETRARQVLELCRKYGAGVVALTIDEKGMAKTSEDKVAIAERLLTLCREYGLPEHDIFIDCLTFTLASGDEEFRQAGIATIDAIAELKKRYPGINMLLGISNISFGLKPAARQALNSVFLHYARESGLNSAIVHFSKILPENRIEPEIWKIASDLVYDRRQYSA